MSGGPCPAASLQNCLAAACPGPLHKTRPISSATTKPSLGLVACKTAWQPLAIAHICTDLLVLRPILRWHFPEQYRIEHLKRSEQLRSPSTMPHATQNLFTHRLFLHASISLSASSNNWSSTSRHVRRTSTPPFIILFRKRSACLAVCFRWTTKSTGMPSSRIQMP